MTAFFTSLLFLSALTGTCVDSVDLLTTMISSLIIFHFSPTLCSGPALPLRQVSPRRQERAENKRWLCHRHQFDLFYIFMYLCSFRTTVCSSDCFGFWLKVLHKRLFFFLSIKIYLNLQPNEIVCLRNIIRGAVMQWRPQVSTLSSRTLVGLSFIALMLRVWSKSSRERNDLKIEWRYEEVRGGRLVWSVVSGRLL